MAVISPSAKVQEAAKFINEQLNVNPGKSLSSPVSYTHLTLPTNREV